MWNARDSSVTASDPGTSPGRRSVERGLLPRYADEEPTLHKTRLEREAPAARLRRARDARKDVLAVERACFRQAPRERAAGGSQALAANHQVHADAVLARQEPRDLLRQADRPIPPRSHVEPEAAVDDVVVGVDAAGKRPGAHDVAAHECRQAREARGANAI